LATLRYKLFAQAGYITHEGRKRILKLATAMRKREWISGLWTQRAIHLTQVTATGSGIACRICRAAPS
ncbi:MAG: hypothetical protein ACREUD_01505, partial [Gammaproteobacteria bacterium]